MSDGYSVVGIPITTTCDERHEECVAPRLYARIRTLEALIAPAKAAAEYLENIGRAQYLRNAHALADNLNAALEKDDG